MAKSKVMASCGNETGSKIKPLEQVSSGQNILSRREGCPILEIENTGKLETCVNRKNETRLPKIFCNYEPEEEEIEDDQN